MLAGTAGRATARDGRSWARTPSWMPRHPWRHGRVCLGVLVALVALVAVTPVAAAGTGETIAVGTDGNTVYIAQQSTRALLLVRRDGGIVATRHLGAAPDALALDAQQGLIYVAMEGKGIAVLRSADLSPVLTLRTTIAASSLSAVPGQDALYLFDPATGHTFYLSYTPDGTVHLTPMFNNVRPPDTPSLRLVYNPTAHHAGVVLYWANGFWPGEAVSVSWGARNAGQTRADPTGVASGVLPVSATTRHGPHGVGLYGLSSGLALSGIVVVGPHRHAATPARPTAQPPLVLGFLPGPVATVALPTLQTTFQVPLAAGALPLLPLLLLVPILALRRLMSKKRKRRSTPPAGRSRAA